MKGNHESGKGGADSEIDVSFVALVIVCLPVALLASGAVVFGGVLGSGAVVFGGVIGWRLAWAIP